MTQKTLLITGHRGYIGSVMAPYFVRRGYEVIGLDTSYFGSECTLIPDPIEIKAIRKDLRDLHVRDLQGVNAVIHLAAICNDPLGNLNPEWTVDINYHGTMHLAKIAKQCGVSRFLLSSSCSMHGASTDAQVTEMTPVHPLTPYGQSKIQAEEALRSFADERFSPSYLRNGTVYGISPRHRLDIVLNNLVGWAVTTGAVKVMSNGAPWRPVIHVEDVCQAFAVILEAPREHVQNEAFHIGTNAMNVRIRDLAETVAHVVSGCRVEYVNEAGADQRTYIADFSKLAQRFPHFHPQWTPERGAQQLAAAYRECGLTKDDMTGQRYIRLNRMRQLVDGGQLDETLRWK